MSDCAKMAANGIIMVSNYTEPTHVHSLQNIKEDIEVHMVGVGVSFIPHDTSFVVLVCQDPP